MRRWSTRQRQTDSNWISAIALPCIQQHTCSYSAVRQMSGSRYGVVSACFTTSRAAVMIEGSIVRLEPSVEAVRNYQTWYIGPSGRFQCFLPDCQAKTVILRGIFRHLVLQHKSIVQYSVGFKSWVRTWAPSFENISKSYSHVLFLNTKMAKKSPKNCLTFGCQAMSGTDSQEGVDSGTPGSQIWV